MIRTLSAAVLAVTLLASTSFAQDGPLRRAGRALDNTGKNIRGIVETEVARGQISAQERDVLNRVSRRIEWDKQMMNSALQLEVRPGGQVVVRGSVMNELAKKRAIDLVENTIGVTSIIDELAVVKDVKVIQVRPAPAVIESVPTVVTPPPPAEVKVIVKP